MKLAQMPWKDMVLPRHVAEAVRMIGVRETPGAGNNSAILGWADECGLGNIYKADSTPWCGLFVAVCLKRAGRPILANWENLRARSWANWGVPVNPERAALGDILVFSRPGGGHVGFYVGEDAHYYYVLGGNQGDAVSIAKIAKARCIAINRPVYNNQPESVKQYLLSFSGPASLNEA